MEKYFKFLVRAILLHISCSNILIIAYFYANYHQFVGFTVLQIVYKMTHLLEVPENLKWSFFTQYSIIRNIKS